MLKVVSLIKHHYPTPLLYTRNTRKNNTDPPDSACGNSFYFPDLAHFNSKGQPEVFGLMLSFSFGVVFDSIHLFQVLVS